MNIKCKYIFLDSKKPTFHCYRAGIKYAGEIHFVHTNPKTSQSAVLGFFMQSNRETKSNTGLPKTENRTFHEWKRYLIAAENLRMINNSVILSLNLASLIGSNLNDFWRYEGSLTTPPCTEGIIWTIFKVPIVFSEKNINTFRTNIFSEDYRSLQPLNNRTVYRNFLQESISGYHCCSTNKTLLTDFYRIDIIYLY